MHGPHTALAEAFLTDVPPFSLLPAEARRELARVMVVDFLPRDATILAPGDPLPHALFIQKGAARVLDPPSRDPSQAPRLHGLAAEGDGLCLEDCLRGHPASRQAQTMEDTFLMLLPREDLLRCATTHPVLVAYWLDPWPAPLLELALDSRVAAACQGASASLLGVCVGDTPLAPAVTVPLGTSIRQAALRMVDLGVGALLVADPSGDCIGIVTDSDLRKTVAFGMDGDAPVEVIMSFPVERVDPEDTVFTALVRMMTRGIHHLAVGRDDAVTGLLGSQDILVLQGKSPVALFKEIMTQRQPEGLHALGRGIPQVLRAMLEEGAAIRHVLTLAAVLGDALRQRLLTLLSARLGPSPAPFRWLVLDEEGRGERILPGPRRHALVHASVRDDIVARAAGYYLDVFAAQAREHFHGCGQPAGEADPADPRWRRSLDQWEAAMEQWIAGEAGDAPAMEWLLDARALDPGRGREAGRETGQDLGRAPRERLLNRLAEAGPDCPALAGMARRLAATNPPLGFFRDSLVESDGGLAPGLDLQARLLEPLAHAARLLAARHGLRETGTLERLERAAQRDRLPADLARGAVLACEAGHHIRLVHRLAQLLAQPEGDAIPPETIPVSRLRPAERHLLIRCFQSLRRLRDHLTARAIPPADES